MEKWKKVIQTEMIQLMIIKQRQFKNQRYFSLFNVLVQTFSLIFFILSISTTLPASNRILQLIQNIRQQLINNQPSLDFSLILISIDSIFLGTIIIGTLLKKYNQFNQYNKQILFVETVQLYSYIIFEFTVLPLLILIFSVQQFQNIQEITSDPQLIIAIILSEIILQIPTKSILFRQYLILLVIVQAIGNIFIAEIFLTVFCFRLARKSLKLEMTIAYIEIGAISMVKTITEYFKVEVNTLNLLVLTLSIVLLSIFSPSPILNFASKTEQNDYLINALGKVIEQGVLSTLQLRNINLIKFYILQNQLLNGINVGMNQLRSMEDKQLTKESLHQLIKIKLKIDQLIDSANLSHKISRCQAKLLAEKFSLKFLYEVQDLNEKFQNDFNFHQKLRMKRLANKIQIKYFNNEEIVNISLIILIDSVLEQFYNKIGSIIENLLLIWSEIKSTSIIQTAFFQKAKEMIYDQQKCQSYLKFMQPYRNNNIESQIMNSLKKVTNMNESQLETVNQKRQQNLRYFNSTKYILVYDNRIQDISQQFCQELGYSKQNLLDKQLSYIFNDIFNVFYSKNSYKFIESSVNQSQIKRIMLFKIMKNDDTFLACQYKLKIVPNLNQKIRYFIHILNNQQLQMDPYIIYSLQEDRVRGVSKEFCPTLGFDQNKIQLSLYGIDFFGVDISTILSCQQHRNSIKCIFNRNKFQNVTNSKKSIRKYNQFEAKLFAQQNYSFDDENILLMRIIPINQNILLETKTFKIESFLLIKDKLTIKSIAASQATTKAQIFCQIPNPTLAIIDQKISNLNDQQRFSYHKIIAILMFLQLLGVVIAIIYMGFYTQTQGQTFLYKYQVNSFKDSIIQNLYLVFYQYYQYYQILNYPWQILEIQPYKISSLVTEYKTKTNKNIDTLTSQLISSTTPQKYLPYVAQFTNYKNTQYTVILNFADFLLDIKQSLITNNPIFTVRNEHIVDLMVSSFERNSINIYVQQFTYTIYYSFLTFGIVLAFIFVVIKLIAMRIHSFVHKMFQVYARITVNQIDIYTGGISRFMDLLICNKKYKKQNIQLETLHKIEENQQLESKQQSYKHITLDKHISKGEIKKAIKKESYILKNNLLFIIPIVFLIGSAIFYNQLLEYQNDINKIIDYSQKIQDYVTLILQMSEHFFQSAIQQILPPASRLPWSNQTVVNLDADLIHLELPSYFQNYRAHEISMLGYNLCAYSYLNTGSLYVNLNCSLIFDGAMNRGFSETYILLIKSLQDYGGVLMKDLGKTKRPGAKYPLFMQINYARRTINNMLVALQAQFNTTAALFIKDKQAYHSQLLYYQSTLIPIIFIVMAAFYIEIAELSNIAVKTFKLLPRIFIKKISISKYLIKSKLLQQLQRIAI